MIDAIWSMYLAKNIEETGKFPMKTIPVRLIRSNGRYSAPEITTILLTVRDVNLSSSVATINHAQCKHHLSEPQWAAKSLSKTFLKAANTPEEFAFWKKFLKNAFLAHVILVIYHMPKFFIICLIVYPNILKRENICGQGEQKCEQVTARAIFRALWKVKKRMH